jgi:serine/threonine-protein kinase
MGEVYRARDTKLNRDVALKILSEAFSLDSDRIARFRREAQALAVLNHPNIAAIYGFEDSGSTRALVLELVEGPTLEDRIATGALPIVETLLVARQIADALEAAHQHGVVHRDLKPANIKLRPDGRVKLLDFGLAQFASADPDVTLTMDGTIVGTMAYMSPEQATGRPLDARSDIFSFGVVLYEILAGHRAFGGTSMGAVLNAVLHGEPPPIQVSGTLDRIVHRCLQKQAGQRFQTMAEVKAALEQASRASAMAKSAEPMPSIAVLPFADMSAGKDHEWFSDGLTEEIINALAQIPGLRVIARTSAFAFKGKQKDVRRIGEALGVGHLLEGSVRRAGDRVRITAQLVTAGDGSHLWSDRYDRNITDVFAIQDEIAHTISNTLKVRLSAVSATSERHIPNIAAYESYLKALHAVGRWSFEEAWDHTEQAIVLDPAFAAAHAMRGFLLWILSVRQSPTRRVPAHDVVPRAKEALLKALVCDAEHPQAHAILGILAAIYDYDWLEAESRLKKALARPPIPSRVVLMAGQLLVYLGRAAEGAELIRTALLEDPLNTTADDLLGFALAASGRALESITQYERALERNPHFFAAGEALAIIHLSQGHVTDALSFAERAVTAAPGNPSSIGILAGLHRRTGNVSRADALVGQLGDGTRYGDPIGLALYHAVADEGETSTQWLEKAIVQRDPRVLIFLRLSIGQVWRASARWPELAITLNLRA